MLALYKTLGAKSSYDDDDDDDENTKHIFYILMVCIYRKMRSIPYSISEESLSKHKQAQKGRGRRLSGECEKGQATPFNEKGKPLGEHKKGICRK